MRGRVLLIDDDPDITDLVSARLRHRELDVVSVASAEEALPLAQEGGFDTVLTDLKLPGIDGVTLCSRLAESSPDLPVIVMTAHGTMSTAIDALRAGAQDFILKPIELDELQRTIERTIQHRRLDEEVTRLRQIVSELQGGEGLIGQSGCMLELKRQISRVARTDATVLITGESGTGKEMVARAIQQSGSRREGPFVAVNCAALPEQIFESELFGHVRGSFTDAHTNRAGLFVTANGGTIFLDEIAELPLTLQVKLLRVLQDRRIRPVGATSEIPIDVRILAATNHDLVALVEAGKFREDLYYRLNVINIEVPPLRARGNDVLLLAQSFLRRFAQQLGKHVEGLLGQTAEHLLAHDWPGNVRELQNCIERAVALTRYDRLTVDDLPSHLRTTGARPVFMLPGDDLELLPTLEQVERRYIEQVMRIVGGNKTTAARILGVDRRTLHRKFPSTAADREASND